MNLFVLTFGSGGAASTKYRWLQYANLFRRSGVNFHHAPLAGFRDFESLREYDVVVLQKTIVSGSIFASIRQNSRRLIYDIDDRIWLSPDRQHSWFTHFRIRRRMKKIARGCDLCISANSVIAEDICDYGGISAVIPMALDSAEWRYEEKTTGLFRIGWSGAPKNLFYLHKVLPALRRLQAKYPEVEWQFHSGVDPQFDHFRYKHLPFVAGFEPSTVRGFHIGLVPLTDSPFARAKSPIKILQYFASSVPVVASGFGATLEMVQDQRTGLVVRNEDEWETAVELLIRDRTLRTGLSDQGRSLFESRHEVSAVHPLLMRALSG